MKNLVTVILILVSFCSNGQMVTVKEKTSGYFGKRFLIGLSGSFGVSTNYQKANAASSEESLITLNRDFALNLQYAQKNTRLIGLYLGRSTTSCKLSNNYYNSSELIGTDGKKYDVSYIFGSPKITDLTYGLEIKFLSKNNGSLAPIGRYYSFALIAHRFTIDHSTTILQGRLTNNSSSSTITLPYVIATSTRIIPELAMTFGISKPIMKDLFFDFGLKLGYLMKNNLIDIYVDSNEERFQIMTNELCYDRLMWREFVNLNLGFYYPF